MPKELISAQGEVTWSAAHSAYGRVIKTEGDGSGVESPFRLLGQVADDEAELTWTRFRCFDPEVGAWISTDPLEIAGGLNLYGFDGAPTGVVDPLGLSGNPHDTKVIGRRDDTEVLQGEPGYDVLNDPNWTLAKNDAWVAEGVANQQNFYMASPTAGNMVQTSGRFAGQETVYARELGQLNNAGYQQVGDHMVHPANLSSFTPP